MKTEMQYITKQQLLLNVYNSAKSIKQGGPTGQELLLRLSREFKGLGNARLDTNGSGESPVAGSCEHDNELSSSMKGCEFLN